MFQFIWIIDDIHMCLLIPMTDISILNRWQIWIEKKRTWSYFYIKHNLIQKKILFVPNKMHWFWVQSSLLFFFFCSVFIWKKKENVWIRWCRCLQTFPYWWLIASVNSCQLRFIENKFFFFFNVCLFFFFCTNVQASSKRTGKHTQKHTLIDRIWVRNRLKNAYHIHNHHHHHQTKTEATEKKKKIGEKKNEEEMHSFSRIKCDRETEKKTGVNNETKR